MLFQKRIERAQKWLKDTNPDNHHQGIDEDLPSMEELKRESQELPLDKSDIPVMIFTALITIVPVCLLVLLLLCGFVFFL